MNKYDSDQYEGNVADIDVNFKNLLYDLYSKDLSMKVKASLRAAKEQGKSVCSVPPFGYAKDSEDRHKYVIDEDDASIDEVETLRKKHEGLVRDGRPLFCLKNHEIMIYYKLYK